MLLSDDVGTADENACEDEHEDTCMLISSAADADVDAHLTCDDASSIISSAESPVAPSFSSISGMCIHIHVVMNVHKRYISPPMLPYLAKILKSTSTFCQVM